MPNRVLKDSIKCSSQIDSLTWFQEVMFYRLMVTVDDFGRYYANPQIIKSELFPTKEDITKKSVEDGLDVLEKVGLIKRYQYDGNLYLEVVTWMKHQQRRATKSKFPDSNGNHVLTEETKSNHLKSIDIKCNQMKSNDSNGNQMRSNDSNGNQMSPNTKTKSNTKTKTISDDDPDAVMISIQREHDSLFDEAKSIGLPLTDRNMSEIVRLYTEYGLEAVMHGIREASRLNKISIAYIETVAKNYGKAKEDDGLPDMSEILW